MLLVLIYVINGDITYGGMQMGALSPSTTYLFMNYIDILDINVPYVKKYTHAVAVGSFLWYYIHTSKPCIFI